MGVTTFRDFGEGGSEDGECEPLWMGVDGCSGSSLWGIPRSLGISFHIGIFTGNVVPGTQSVRRVLGGVFPSHAGPSSGLPGLRGVVLFRPEPASGDIDMCRESFLVVHTHSVTHERRTKGALHFLGKEVSAFALRSYHT